MLTGKPSTPVLSSGSVPEIERSLSFTCSSSSTTVPSDHGLSLSYTWSINGQTDPTDSRYTYTGNTLTISNVQRTDKNKTVACTAKEVVNGVQKTSDTSNQLRVDVYCKCLIVFCVLSCLVFCVKTENIWPMFCRNRL